MENKVYNFDVKFSLEIHDFVNPDWNPFLKQIWQKYSVKGWIEKINSLNVDYLTVRLTSTHPDLKNSGRKEVKAFLEEVLKYTDLPLIVVGTDKEKDTDILPYVAEILKGRDATIGVAVQENYKTLTASAIANNLKIIAETPLDVNLAKQLNILISNMGMPKEKIIMHHTTGGLGYGLEYCYSIMERCRIAKMKGDEFLSQDMLNFVGEFSWNTKESATSEALGINWETVTAVSYMLAGAGILVLNYPETLKRLRKILSG